MTDKSLPNLFYTNELLFKRSLSFRVTCWIIYRLNSVSETCSKIIGDSGYKYNHSWSIRVVMSLVGDELIEVNDIVPLLCMSLNFQNKVVGFFFKTNWLQISNFPSNLIKTGLLPLKTFQRENIYSPTNNFLVCKAEMFVSSTELVSILDSYEMVTKNQFLFSHINFGYKIQLLGLSPY